MSKKPGIYFNLYRSPAGVWKSTMKFQTSAEGDAVTVSGCCMGSWYGSLKKMTSKARTLLTHPRAVAAMTQIAPFIPGGTGALAALSIVNAVSNGAKSGALKKVTPQMRDKTLKQLAAGMQRIAEGNATQLPGGPMLLVEPDAESRAVLDEVDEAKREARADALKKARDVIAWGKRNAKTDEGRKLVARAEKQYKQLAEGRE